MYTRVPYSCRTQIPTSLRGSGSRVSFGPGFRSSVLRGPDLLLVSLHTGTLRYPIPVTPVSCPRSCHNGRPACLSVSLRSVFLGRPIGDLAILTHLRYSSLLRPKGVRKVKGSITTRTILDSYSVVYSIQRFPV